jgi:hypothetical protein
LALELLPVPSGHLTFLHGFTHLTLCSRVCKIRGGSPLTFVPNVSSLCVFAALREIFFRLCVLCDLSVLCEPNRVPRAGGSVAPAVTCFDRSSKPWFTSPIRQELLCGAKRISVGDRIDGAQHSHLAGCM